MMPQENESDRLGYADVAQQYREAGWLGVLPIRRPNAKFPPPDDFTGYGAPMPSYPDVLEWSEQYPKNNVALRMPDDVIGIDVDAYDGKTGALTLAHAEEIWGELPPAPISTSRAGDDDQVSGIRLFRVPPGTRLKTVIGFDDGPSKLGHVEILQHHHRYAIVWPSTHPDTGGTYAWLSANRSPAEIPDPADLPELPAAWLDGLEPDDLTEAGSVDISAALAKLTTGPMSGDVSARVTQAAVDLGGGAGSRHDVMTGHVMGMLRASEQGKSGVVAGLLQLRSIFVFAVRDRSIESEAVDEFNRMVMNPRGHALIAASQTVTLEDMAGKPATIDRPGDRLLSPAERDAQALRLEMPAPTSPSQPVEISTLPTATEPEPDADVEEPTTSADLDERFAELLAELEAASHRSNDPTVPALLDQIDELAAIIADRDGVPVEEFIASSSMPPIESTATVAESKPAEPARAVEADQPTEIATSPEAASRLETLLDLEAGFWGERESLSKIYQHALSRLASPWAVFGVCAARAIATVPYWITLPPLVGGRGSLNTFVAFVGRSGDGKGAAEAAAADLVPVEDLKIAPAGSGEGLVHQYAHMEKGEIVRDATSVMFSIPEVDTLVGIGARSGSTIMSKIRNAYSGEDLGFSYADPTKRITLGSHTYRLTMVLGVQPSRARPLIDDAAGGTPQRFIWMPATDPRISADAPPEPTMLFVPDSTEWGGYQRSIAIPDEARDTIRDARVRRARGDAEALDGHSLFTREKVMVALAALDGRTEVDLDDWRLAGVVMSISDLVRGEIVAGLSAEIEAEAVDRGVAAGIAREVADTTAFDRKLNAITKWALGRLQREGPMTFGALRRSAKSDRRDLVEDAVLKLHSAGLIAFDDLTQVVTPLVQTQPSESTE